MKTDTPVFIRLQPIALTTEFLRILLANGFTKEKATACAEVFTTNSIDGVYSHGVNRFPKFIEYVKSGGVLPNAEPVNVSGFGGIEQWNGNMGPGPLNALQATERAMLLARKNGIGCVALGNTNHWMRGGLYGWKAAKEGFVFIGWSNTIANMPAWNANDNRLGNNPLVIAIPYADEAIVLDMAMSQYSFGAIEMALLKNEQLAVAGGYDLEGNVTNDPQAIMQSKKGLPMGYWKGAGLSLLLDMLAALLSAGNAVKDISKQEMETGLSQIFIAIDLKALNNFKSMDLLLQQIVDDYHQSVPIESGKKIIYPGERVLMTRIENLEKGIPVAEKVWEKIKAL
ncbi:3-dehydro-L-gulonate 2-dehydrogenase [Ferruginibacter paludis]|uniref:3-dehydro-L-gulonate 2-dehydrogenase n=1 Tax=Ferruginibacter paludis TaxID=1310417 RepID=UPI0025B2A6D8|nr:3-dehydro-L-gulonate 2-dehydrogenase [Ferruginibacter paludis]MDN3658304.1 3-dehydro-L-gulonate 2-dehydrogenase [Ferruginibacter paludis]